MQLHPRLVIAVALLARVDPQTVRRALEGGVSETKLAQIEGAIAVLRGGQRELSTALAACAPELASLARLERGH